MTKSFTIPLTKAIAAADLVEIERDGVWHKLSIVSKNAIGDFVKNGAHRYENGFTSEGSKYTLVFGSECSGVIYIMIDTGDRVVIDNKGMAYLPSKSTEVQHNGLFTKKNDSEPLDTRIRFTMFRPCCMNFADTQKIKTSQ